MKLFITLCLSFVFSLSIQSQIQVNSDDLGELRELEQSYIDNNNDDSKGIDLIKDCNTKYELLSKTYKDNGLKLDLTDSNKKEFKKHPNLKVLFDDYEKALKVKVKYFVKKQPFAKILKRSYPEIDNQ
jgi:hypothetical protein